jgi:U4/U6.U5 tri-snRNP-associated protein 2
VLISANVSFVDLSCNNVANHPHLRTDLRRHGSLVDLDAPPSHPPTVYDLIANVTHESVAGTTRDKENTVWKVHLRVGGGGGDGEKWLQIQDLIVEETRKEMIFLAETVLQVRILLMQVGPLLKIVRQIWERRDAIVSSIDGATRMNVDRR